MIIDEERLKDFVLDVVKEAMFDLLNLTIIKTELGGTQIELKIEIDIKGVGSIADSVVLK